MTELELMRDFGENLKSLLDEWGMSQQELADEIDVGKSTISKYINGTGMPSLVNVINIAYVLECNIEELIDIDFIRK